MEGIFLALIEADEAKLMQPAVLAFIGDAVFNLFIRERLISNKKGTSHRLHILATDYVKAASQSRISKALIDTFTGTELFALILGMAVAFIVSMVVIKFLMAYIRKHDFKVFGWYRIVLGIVVILYFTVF
jgi:hypothetical protein